MSDLEMPCSLICLGKRNFAPILTLYALNKKIPQNLLIAMMISALLSVLLWRKLGFNADFNEIAFGMIISFVIYFIFKK